MTEPSDLKKTELYDLHLEEGAKMVPFAGYAMPLQYETGIRKEHLYCRKAVGLFDVSHMGQAALIGPDYETAARALEALVPGDIVNLKPGKLRYSLLLNNEGGIEDDLMISHRILPDGQAVVGLVVNAARKTHDYALISSHLPDDVDLIIEDDRSLLALQGPLSEQVIAIWCGGAVGMPYMSEIDTRFFDTAARISRSGYTGEDGFEISLPAGEARRIAEMLLSYEEVEMIGLGARDSLRLEAGFCLYGHDIDETSSPVEAGLSWVINKRRRKEGGFPGAERILYELSNGPARARVGLLAEGASPPAREGAELFGPDGTRTGAVTSGGFSPSLNRPVAMGYVAKEHARPGSVVEADVRGRRYRWQVSELPFVPFKTYKAKKPTQH